MSNFGFTYKIDNETVSFFRNNKLVKRIKGVQASKFIEFISSHNNSDIQIEMAKLTGNYKRGNERTAKNHLRNTK